MPRTHFTINEAARAKGVSPTTFRRLVKAGKVKAVRLSPAPNSKWLIPAAALTRFVRQMEAV
jgi:excisionase family DNA binding protein